MPPDILEKRPFDHEGEAFPGSGAPFDQDAPTDELNFDTLEHELEDDFWNDDLNESPVDVPPRVDTDEYDADAAEFGTGGHPAVTSAESDQTSASIWGPAIEILLDPKADADIKLAVAMGAHRNCQDFKRHAEEGAKDEFRVTEDQIYDTSLPKDEHDRTPGQRLVLAATDYAEEQQKAYKEKVDAYLDNNGFVSWIDDKDTIDADSLIDEPPYILCQKLEDLKTQYEAEQAEAQRKAEEEAARKAAEAKVREEEQQREERGRLIEADEPGEEAETLPADLSPGDTPSSGSPKFKKVLPGVSVMKDDQRFTLQLALPTAAAATARVKTTTMGASIRAAEALGHVGSTNPAAVAAAAAVTFGGGGMDNLVNNESPDAALTRPFERMEQVAEDVPDASQTAEELHGLDPSQTIPGKIRWGIINSAFISNNRKLDAVMEDRELKASESDNRLNRRYKVVRDVDDAAGYALELERDNPELTSDQVTNISRSILHARLAARFPSTASDDIEIKTTTTFEKKIADSVAETILAGNTSFRTKQKEFVGALIGKAFEETTTEAEQAEVLSRFKKKAEEIAGMEAHVENPKITNIRLAAALTAIESSEPAKNVINPKGGATGIAQFMPEFWGGEDGFAAKHLNDPHADINNLDNQLMVTIAMLHDYASNLGSGRAAMAAWLKGYDTAGKAIAGRDQTAYNEALIQADGIGTSVLSYINNIEKKVKEFDDSQKINEQLPFLEEVKKRNPDFKVNGRNGWELLDEEYPMYPSLHMDKLQAAAERRAAERAKTPEREVAGDRIAATLWRHYKKYGNKNLETGGANTGPVVKMYTGGPQGREALWCSWFVSYIYREAGYKFEGSPASTRGDIPAVANMGIWFKKYGIQFRPGAKGISPRPGDVIIYNGSQHDGIVAKVKGDTIETIEGNTKLDGSYSNDGVAVSLRRFNYRKDPRDIKFGRLKNP